MHRFPSLQVVPFALVGFEHTPVEVLQVPSVWHWSDAVQTTGFEPVQVPDWQVSVWVQGLPSLHVVPFAFAGFEHTPVEVLQIPSVWHWSDAEQTTGFAPLQTPDWQVSVWVQALPSLHVVPFAFGVTVQVEVPLQARVLHWSPVHVIVVPEQVPAPSHRSL